MHNGSRTDGSADGKGAGDAKGKGAIAVAACCGVVRARAWLARPCTAGHRTRAARRLVRHAAGDETAARAFFPEHGGQSAEPGDDRDAPAAARERSNARAADAARGRGRRRHAFAVRCKVGNGDEVVARFEGEPAAPHRLLCAARSAAARLRRGAAAARGSCARRRRGRAAGQAWLDARAASGAWSGAALVARGDVLVTGAWGEADRAKKIPNTADTRFNVGSIGKMFAHRDRAARAGGQAVARRPAFAIPAGLPARRLDHDRDAARAPFGRRRLLQRRLRGRPDKAKLRHNRDYLPLFRDQPLWFAPGTSERYSNGGYVLLGEVIAKASGEDYYEYLAKHVFGPAGMTATAARSSRATARRASRGLPRRAAADGARQRGYAPRARQQ